MERRFNTPQDIDAAQKWVTEPRSDTLIAHRAIALTAARFGPEGFPECKTWHDVSARFGITERALYDARRDLRRSFNIVTPRTLQHSRNPSTAKLTKLQSLDAHASELALAAETATGAEQESIKAELKKVFAAIDIREKANQDADAISLRRDGLWCVETSDPKIDRTLRKPLHVQG